ncbi:hypothetical protein FQA39_LY19177 [Lamprigera yunnana]|nr:hypothetical protein FQA39_LY19177 [Lamprigera yunnana]
MAAEAVAWLALTRAPTAPLQTDSRQVQPGDAFIAWPGGVTDGRAYVAQAVERGALACLVEQEGMASFAWQGLPVMALQSLKAATAVIASEWFAKPTDALDVMAVTGTNGKTSISWWLAQAPAGGRFCLWPCAASALMPTIFAASTPPLARVAALCSVDPVAAGLPGIVVPDALQALGALATGWRAQFALPLIAVTASNGKTTVTQMIAAILRAHAGDAAFATRGNLNNEIGVPLTLLGLQASHRLGVVELGMNHPGEIAVLAAMAQPTVALVNNAQREHQEFMHTVQAVAQENGSVISALPGTGVAVFPAGDSYTALWADMAAGRSTLMLATADAPARVLHPMWPGDGRLGAAAAYAQGKRDAS